MGGPFRIPTRREIGPDVHGRVRDLIDGAVSSTKEEA